MHATAFLKASEKQKIGPIVALHGSERSLKLSIIQSLLELVAGTDDEETSLTRFPGKDLELKTVRDELLTVSMFSDQRLVVVEEADKFVSANRAGLEKYLEKPSKKSVLILDVKSWPKNTRLAKVVAKIGLDVDCGELKGGGLHRWLQETARDCHNKQLPRDAAMLLTELAGTGLGLLEQELEKLAIYIGDRNRISAEDVQKLVGGWKAETTWTMVDSVRDGRPGVALSCLGKLLVAGEAPLRILGGISYTFRKLAKATELARQGQPLAGALKTAGIFPRDIDKAAYYLRRVGRPEAEKIYSRLAQTDANLKGGSQLPDRVQLERLLIELSGCSH